MQLPVTRCSAVITLRGRLAADTDYVNHDEAGWS